MKDNAWFVGFAPRENPEIVVVALFEGGEFSNLAAPIARDVIKAYFDKKARVAKAAERRVAFFKGPMLEPPPGPVRGGADGAWELVLVPKDWIE